jgi:hypothetical protein
MTIEKGLTRNKSVFNYQYLVCFVETNERFDKVLRLRSQCPDLTFVLVKSLTFLTFAFVIGLQDGMPVHLGGARDFEMVAVWFTA